MAKESITIRIQADLIDALDDEAKENNVTRSEYVRGILQDRHESKELRKETDSLQDRLDSREQRISELEEQLARRSNIEKKIEELPDKVQGQTDQSNAPFFVNWYKWWRDRGE